MGTRQAGIVLRSKMEIVSTSSCWHGLKLPGGRGEASARSQFCSAQHVIQEAFRKMNGTTLEFQQTGRNLTLSALLNKVLKARKNLRNIVLAHLNRKQSEASK
jgi:hypothetical protein